MRRSRGGAETAVLGVIIPKGEVLAFCQKRAEKSTDLENRVFWRPIWPPKAPKNRTQKWQISPSGPSVTGGHFCHLAPLVAHALKSTRTAGMKV